MPKPTYQKYLFGKRHVVYLSHNSRLHLTVLKSLCLYINMIVTLLKNVTESENF